MYKVDPKADYTGIFESKLDSGQYDIRYRSETPYRILRSERRDEEQYALVNDITIVEVLNCDTRDFEDLSSDFVKTLIHNALPGILRQATEESFQVLSSWTPSMVYEGPE